MCATELFALAFENDPTWSWSLSDPDRRLEQLRQFWGLLLHTAIPYGSVYLAKDRSAATLWIPPGRPQLNAADEGRVEPLLHELVGDRATDNHPHDQPHFYLSPLSVHPDHRGAGKGMGLLSEQLTVLDRLGIPSYLESSNRANDHRYERLGYRQIGEFAVPGGTPTLACMWRDVPR